MFNAIVLAATLAAGPSAPADTCAPTVELITPVVTVVADVDPGQLACYIVGLGDTVAGKTLAVSRADSGELVLVITATV